jgi:hypothetical protein
MTSSGIVRDGIGLADTSVEPLADGSVEPVAEADSLLAAGDALEESALGVEEQPTSTVERATAAVMAAILSEEVMRTRYASVR